MPKRRSRNATFIAAVGLSITLLWGLLAASSASAKTAPVDLRVLTSEGKTLVDQRQYVAPITVRTSPKATCFGPGTGGSGATAKLDALTAMGALQNAALTNRALNPILLTDHDFGFGASLGLCGIGMPTPAGQFWFLKTDRKNPQISAEKAAVKRKGTVLFYLMPFDGCDPNPPYACAPELVVNAPARVKPGRSFIVRVTAFDDSGKRKPVEGAKVTGAASPTDASGRTQVTLNKTRVLVAEKAGSVPSSPWKVCVNADPSKCPPAPGLRIVGSGQKDSIVGTPGPDVVLPGRGGNVVNVRGGSRDRVLCLGKKHGDVVIADRQDVVSGCAKVRRR